jgi:hypothetical protein
VIDIPIRGYGAALYGAVLRARGRHCIMGDSDDSYDFSRLEPFVEALRGGADLVMRNRLQGGIMPGAMPWKNRYSGNPVLSGIGRILFGCPAGDFHCGMRGFSKAALERMDLRTTGMEFASEMVIRATLMGMKIKEVPTISPDGRSRPPHLRPYRHGWRHLRFMLLFSPDRLFLYPGWCWCSAASRSAACCFPSAADRRGAPGHRHHDLWRHHGRDRRSGGAVCDIVTHLCRTGGIVPDLSPGRNAAPLAQLRVRRDFGRAAGDQRHGASGSCAAHLVQGRGSAR